ncbi:MAG TPA: GEVED domain-containing protein, partial [bacterium]
TFFLTPDGPVGPGEVEDYKVEIGEGLTPVPRGGYFGGAKFNDLNGNGICDFGEPGLPNWTIWLDMNGNGTYDAGVDKTTQTDANGLFNFTGLSDGSYVVGEIPQPGWVQTYPGGAGTNTVNVKSGTISVLYAAFGNHQTTTPGGGTPGGEGALKWYQPPLRHPEKQEKRCYYGWSEKSLEGSISIADDWFCYNARPVTSITWWGAYAGWDNIAPPPDAPPLFHIGVWSNAVIENEQDFGHPKKMIREWYIERSRLGEKADKCNMMPEWMQKPDTSFQYTFSIPKDEQFVQDGDSTVYWLSIAAVYPEPPNDEHVWGWLTRERYFNNDAVRILEPAKARPDSLFRIGETIPMQWDMAFVLGTDQNTGIFDFGDATDELNTTLARNGALHLIRHDVRLGETVDAENDGQPDPQALGDDKNGSADEDGVTFLSDLVPGNMAKAAVSASTIGFLNAWLDINGNGKWDPRERILNNLSLRAGNQKLEFPVADDATPGERIVRFRFSTFPYVWVKGFAPDGEVEDYQVTIQQPSTGVNDRKTGAQPGEFKLFPNYPNPFNPSTTIRFDLPKTVHVRLSVYNLLGQEIAVLDDADRTQGAHEVRWDGFDMHHRSVPAGVYIYRLEAGSYGGTGKLLLLK